MPKSTDRDTLGRKKKPLKYPVQVAIKISQETSDGLKALAEKHGSSVTEEGRVALERHAGTI